MFRVLFQRRPSALNALRSAYCSACYRACNMLTTLANRCSRFAAVANWPQPDGTTWRYAGAVFGHATAMAVDETLGLGGVDTMVLPTWCREVLLPVFRFELLHHAAWTDKLEDTVGDRAPEVRKHHQLCQRFIQQTELLFPVASGRGAGAGTPQRPVPSDEFVLLVRSTTYQGFQEVRLHRHRRTVEVFALIEYGRRAYPVLQYSSDARFSNGHLMPLGFPSTQPPPPGADFAAGDFVTPTGIGESLTITRLPGAGDHSSPPPSGGGDGESETKAREAAGPSFPAGELVWVPPGLLQGVVPAALLEGDLRWWQQPSGDLCVFAQRVMFQCRLRPVRARRFGEPLKCQGTYRFPYSVHVTIPHARGDSGPPKIVRVPLPGTPGGRMVLVNLVGAPPGTSLCVVFALWCTYKLALTIWRCWRWCGFCWR